MARLRVCTEDGCHELTTRSRCPEHAGEYDRAHRSADRRRVYSSRRWKGARRAVLRANPWCQDDECTNLATDVNHIRPLADIMAEGGDPYDLANLEGLCKRHHSRRTARETWGTK